MKQEENQFFLLAESSPDAIFVGVRGRFVYLNPATARLLGADSTDQLLGQPILDRVHPQDRAVVAERIRRLYENGESAPSLAQKYLRLDGTPVHVEVSAVPFRYNGEEGGLAFVRDITSRQEALDALRRERFFLRQVIDTSPNLIFVKDRSGSFLLANAAMARAYGTTVAGIEGRTDGDFNISAEEVASFQRADREVMDSRQSRVILEEPVSFADGGVHWHTTSKIPLIGEDGGCDRILGIATDISERKLAHAEQQRLYRTLRLLNDLNTVLLHAEQEEKLLADICQLIVTQGGYLLAWVGFPIQDGEKAVRPVARSGDGAGCLDRGRLSWADGQAGRCPTAEAIQTGETRISHNLPAPLRPCQALIALPLRGDGAAILGALTIYSGEREAFGAEEVKLMEKLADNLAFGLEGLRAKARLATAHKELQAFTYAASHDMKAPLGRINSFSTLLEKTCRDRLDGEGLQFLDFIRQNATRLTCLIDDLLAHAQVEKQVRRLQPVDLLAAVQVVIHEYADQIHRHGAEVRLDLAPVQVQADPHSLAQVLRNLVDNALKYSSQAQPPVIEIGGVEQGERYRFWVRDNGIGLDMVYQDRIFEIFRRLHTYSEYPGSGIGLALVKKAVEHMNGKVWVESEAGRGAGFFVELWV